MKIINFFNTAEQQDVISTITELWITGGTEDQILKTLKDEYDVYMPIDQLKAFFEVIDIQMDLSIGKRWREWHTQEEIDQYIKECKEAEDIF